MISLRELHALTHKRLDMVMDHLRSMPSETLTRHLQGFGRPTLAKQINHVLYCEVAWVRALQNLPEAEWDHDECRLPALVDLRRKVAEQTVEYLIALPCADLEMPLSAYPDYWVGPQRTPAFILHHLITHAFHHKGQIVAMCRILGHPAPDTDLQQA